MISHELPDPKIGYVCVYRHPALTKATEPCGVCGGDDFDRSSVGDYINAYQKLRSVLDWGDDPSFFCACKHRRPPSWGVCRADVRAAVCRGDIVVFVCARSDDNKHWDYYLIGVGTIARTIAMDDRLNCESFQPYAEFFNILGRLGKHGWEQHEVIGSGHSDWKNRMAAPYVIFHADPAYTMFDIDQPVHLAKYTHTRGRGGLEEWIRRKLLGQ